jgi:hypothetical protein
MMAEAISQTLVVRGCDRVEGVSRGVICDRSCSRTTTLVSGLFTRDIRGRLRKETVTENDLASMHAEKSDCSEKK